MSTRVFLLLAAAAALAAFLVPASAYAQAACALRADLLTMLREKYGETRAHTAATNSGALVEVTVNEARQTWSLVLTRPDGWACLISAGEGWRALKPVAEEPKA
jgi:hypothetical protein